MAGSGLGAVMLAVLRLAGIITSQLVPVLCAAIVLFAVSLLIASVKKCL